MPSWQARLAAAYSKIILRRRSWGDEQALARRAWRLFGSPKVSQQLRTRGLHLTPINNEKVRGEWLAVENSKPGVILYFHGGGYVAGSVAGHRPITAALARLSQRRVFSLDYRLAPEHRFPAALDDAVAAYQWLLAQGLSAKAIALAGDSAGGGLALAALLRARDQGLPLPACGVCFSPWTDLAGTGASAQFNDGRCAMFRPENLRQFADVYLGGAAPRDPYASPLFGDLSNLPSLLLQVGSTELLLDDARQLHAKIQAAQGVSRLEVFDDVLHCWQMLDGVVPEARRALEQAAEFIGAHVAPTAEHNETIHQSGRAGRA